MHQWVVDAMGAAGISLAGVTDKQPAPYVPPPSFEELLARGEVRKEEQ